MTSKIGITPIATGVSTYNIPEAQQPNVYENYCYSVHHSTTGYDVVPMVGSTDTNYSSYGLTYNDLGGAMHWALFDSSLSVNTELCKYADFTLNLRIE